MTKHILKTRRANRKTQFNSIIRHDMFILFKHQNISTIGSIVDIHTIKYRAITFSIIIWDLMSKGLWLETFSTLAIRDNKMSKVRWIFYYLLNFLFWWVRMKKHICKPIRLFIDFMSSMRCELNLILNYECEGTSWFLL